MLSNFRHKKFPAVIQPVLDSIEEITRKCEKIFTVISECKGNSLEVDKIEGFMVELKLLTLQLDIVTK